VPRSEATTDVHAGRSGLQAARTGADTPGVSGALVPADPRPVPDRLTLWPVDDGRFGLDATFQGASGYVNAELHEGSIRAAGVRYELRQELDGGWTLRLGPFPAVHARQVIDSFLGL
jgi:hypothetical protein